MKIGTHNLGSNAFSQISVVKVHAGGVTMRQSAMIGGRAVTKEITLSAEQAQLLKDVL